MAIKRITIRVPAELAARIKKAAGRTPVSSWVTDLVEDRLNDAELERQWQAFYEDVRPSRQDVRRADTLLRRLTKSAARKGAA
ncbi:MAG TPA: hypothetical protein VG937_30155 [Polyangiaceae bacterium]|nr:hypothetical protein [Polyangiaceae bacterium]